MNGNNHYDKNKKVRDWEVYSVFCCLHMTKEYFWILNYPEFILIKFIDWLISWVDKDTIIVQVIIFYGKPEDTFYQENCSILEQKLLYQFPLFMPSW